jgi:cellulose synthase/poly-beta-1,6-N-acetylglucosamine synthase-like glycosyltransferase
MEGLSIIISAWKTKSFIKECLDSIYNSTYIKQNKPFEVLLGIDGDEELLDYVNTIKDNYKNLNIFNNENNVGTYIMFNSLVQYSNYDIIMRFDSDDLMLPNHIDLCFDKIRDDNFIVPLCENIKGDYKPYFKIPIYNPGNLMIYKKLFIKYGKFKEERCYSDIIFSNTLIKNNINVIKNDIITIKKRSCKNSLMNSVEYGINSINRRNIKKKYNIKRNLLL